MTTGGAPHFAVPSPAIKILCRYQLEGLGVGKMIILKMDMKEIGSEDTGLNFMAHDRNK
jgi:hypothetical protein